MTPSRRNAGQSACSRRVQANNQGQTEAAQGTRPGSSIPAAAAIDAISDYAARISGAAPPLTEAQLARLRTILKREA